MSKEKYVEACIKTESGDDYETTKKGKKEFAKFIREKCKDEYNGNGISTKELSKKVGIDYEMFRKIINGQKPTKKRDCIIAIGIVLKFMSGEINEALVEYGMPELDENLKREEFIISQVNGAFLRGDAITLEALNIKLKKNGYPELNIHDKRDAKKEGNSMTDTIIYPYKIKESKVRTLKESIDYFIDPYMSLNTQYDPSRYQIEGEMVIYNEKENNHIYLVSNPDKDGLEGEGYFSSEIIPTGKRKKYKNINNTGEFEIYFERLNNKIEIERFRLLRMLNETKNYGDRISARLCGNSICVFAEEFNYSIPERGEYHVLSYASGKYKLSIYSKSAFMYYYMPEKKYTKYYGHKHPKPIESYTSVEQIEEKINDTATRNAICYQVYKKAFEKLKIKIDELYEKIKSQEVFIQNLNAIYDNPMETLEFYKIEKNFNCIYDEVGEICGCDETADFLHSNGNVITISRNDIYDAFKLGFESIDEIIRIKYELGDIKYVIK